MPNQLSLSNQTPKITHSPLEQLAVNAASLIRDAPSMTDEILFGAINTLLGWIDDATGLNLLGFATWLEGMFGPEALLTKFADWLLPGGSLLGGGVFGSLLNILGHSTIDALGAFLNPANLLSAPGVLAPLLSGGLIFGGLIPLLDASKIISGTFPLSMISGLLSGGQVLLSLIPNLPATQIVSGLFSASLIPLLDASKIISGVLGLAQIPTLPSIQVPDLLGGLVNLFNGWFGVTTGTGTPAEITVVAESIRAAVAGGYTLWTFTTTNTGWSVPSDLANATEAWAGAVGGGGKGATGGVIVSNTAGIEVTGGPSSISGGINVNRFDPATLGATLSVSIGAAATAENTNGGVSTILNGATVLAQSTPGTGGMSNGITYLELASAPGNGGRGGDAGTNVTATAGTAGTSSQGAAGGAGGAASNGSGSGTGGNGGNGIAGVTNNIPITSGGGGGGGGGSSRWSGVFPNAVGGKGGNGGYPGGASGSGGAAGCNSSATPGAPGTPANGFGFILAR